MIVRLMSSLLFAAAFALPASAGNFAIAKLPHKGVFAQADGCAYGRALDVLDNNQMTLVASVPRTDALYRFVVDWKSDLFAVTVSTSDCRMKVVDYARAIQPYCNYVDPTHSVCRLDLAQ